MKSVLQQKTSEPDETAEHRRKEVSSMPVKISYQESSCRGNSALFRSFMKKDSDDIIVLN